MRVLLADEHSEMRWVLRTVLGEEPGIVVVGEVCSTDALLAQTESLQPDLILLKWELPGQPVSAMLGALNEHAAQARIVVLSGCPEVERAALAAGADGFMSKTDAPDQFLAELRALVRQTAVCCPGEPAQVQTVKCTKQQYREPCR
jgi:DNA-binding NarL/FixJ family response regulator